MSRSTSILVAIFFFVSGCTTASPYLEPAKEEKIPEGKEYITVYTRPVYTKGLFSEDKKKYGIDLSSYFTAFGVKVVNKTERAVRFDISKVELIDSKNVVYKALSETEGVEYYKSGDLGSNKAIVLLPKSRKLVEEDIERIRKIGMPNEMTIQRGGEKEGILLFKKLKEESCRDNLTLKIAGITIEGLKKGKEFEFRFVCPSN